MSLIIILRTQFLCIFTGIQFPNMQIQVTVSSDKWELSESDLKLSYLVT